MPNFSSIGSGVPEQQVAENRYFALTRGIALTTMLCTNVTTLWFLSFVLAGSVKVTDWPVALQWTHLTSTMLKWSHHVRRHLSVDLQLRVELLRAGPKVQTMKGDENGCWHSRVSAWVSRSRLRNTVSACVHSWYLGHLSAVVFIYYSLNIYTKI